MRTYFSKFSRLCSSNDIAWKDKRSLVDACWFVCLFLIFSELDNVSKFRQCHIQQVEYR